METTEFLQHFYHESLQKVGSNNDIHSALHEPIAQYLNEILSRSESAKAVLTVVLTSCVYKILHPQQDIRNHQTSIVNGYSGRTFDGKYITPFLKSVQFPAMAESGWLTRSLEQKVPYNIDYSGAISPNSLKIAFLYVIDFIEQGQNLTEILSYIFQGLIIQRNSTAINLAKPHNLPIITIIELLNKHFTQKYNSDGVARLPVLALYAIYQILIKEIKRFENATLLSLESHTSADMRSGRIGDIDIVDAENKVFEAVEVKYNIQITNKLVKDSFEKFKTTQVKRFYLLSTSQISSEQSEQIKQELDKIKNIHGCHVIVNGITDTLLYYMRLLSDTSQFVKNYVTLIEQDTALKFEHKVAWNNIVSIM